MGLPADLPLPEQEIQSVDPDNPALTVAPTIPDRIVSCSAMRGILTALVEPQQARLPTIPSALLR
jgi:hypothetical protein